MLPQWRGGTRCIDLAIHLRPAQVFKCINNNCGLEEDPAPVRTHQKIRCMRLMTESSSWERSRDRSRDQRSTGFDMANAQRAMFLLLGKDLT